VRAVARALGRPARLVAVPPALLRGAGRAGDLVSRWLPLPLTTAAIDRLAGSLVVDTGRFAAATGFAPPFSLAAGLAETAAWYRSGR
jgi:UDP-glucose 4-epimerase